LYLAAIREIPLSAICETQLFPSRMRPFSFLRKRRKNKLINENNKSFPPISFVLAFHFGMFVH
jgi:hypothetical protein